MRLTKEKYSDNKIISSNEALLFVDMNKKAILFTIKRIRIPLLVIGLLLSVVCSPIIFKVASDKGQDAMQLREKAYKKNKTLKLFAVLIKMKLGIFRYF